MSSLDIAAITIELEHLITGKHLDNVYQTNERTFLFRLRPGGLTLLVEVGRRVHLTNYELTIPRSPPQLSMALRKRLRNAQIISIRQHEFERTILIDLEHHAEKYLLVAELFPRGDLILVDGHDKIDLALWRAKMRDRNVGKGVDYVHAPSSGLNPLTVTLDDMQQLARFKDSNLSRALATLLSAGGTLSREIVLRSNLQDMDMSQVGAEEVEMTFDAIQQLKTTLQSGIFSPEIVFDPTNNPIDVTPFPLRIHEGLKKKACESFNQAADEYFTGLFGQRQATVRVASFGKERERIQRMLDSQEKQLIDLKEAMEINQRRGQLLLSSQHSAAALLQHIIENKRSGEEWNAIVTESQLWPETTSNFRLASIDGRKGIASLLIEGIEVNVTLNKKPQDEAKRYFDLSKDARRKLNGVQEAIDNSRRKLEQAQTVMTAEKAAPRVRPRMVRKWYDSFFHFESSEGFLVLIGRDATSNEVLIKKYTDSSDVVFHAEIRGAPFVVVKTEGKVIGEQTIREACQAAVSYSSAWKSKLSSTDVYYVNPDQVTKEAPSGEYLTRGAFMVRGRRTFVKGVEAKLAVGVSLKDGTVEVLAGPYESIRSRSEWLVIIAPGETSPLEVARQLISQISSTNSLPEDVRRGLDPQEVIRVLPRGGSTLVQRQKTQIYSQ
ncbi:MAG: ribosome rescue protein RqcH [archaeon]